MEKFFFWGGLYQNSLQLIHDLVQKWRREFSNITEFWDSNECLKQPETETNNDNTETD